MNIKQISIAAIREEKPTLSVFVLCYNQEDYILQTIKSILTQKTNFPFDIVISDDASTDGTSEICENLALAYSNIKYIRRKGNLGLMANFVETAKELKGKYVAICDGDDYWIDNNKLQLQVNFLEKNTNYSVVGTRCKQLSANNILNAGNTKMLNPISLEILSCDNIITAPTAVFLNVYRLIELPYFFKKFPYGDWPSYLLVMSLTNTSAYNLNEITAVYRSSVGVSATMRRNPILVAQQNLNIIAELRKMDILNSNKKVFKSSIDYQRLKLVMAYNREKKYVDGLLLMLQILSSSFSFALMKKYLYSIKKSIS
ncbi:glycosyltransferase [Dokdonia sp. Asnod1-B02]|uniref:glycosyltransferase n=1 Tax=Dokdonia sp. Asnod1-B02 TaxID=3160573 RepID=UPI00386E17CB